MYLGGGGRNENGSSSGISGRSPNNGSSDNCWPFGGGAEEAKESWQSGASDAPQGTAFMQSLLDLQGFCVDTKRQQRRQRQQQQRQTNNHKNDAQDNCICLLHQILIKVVELSCEDFYTMMNRRGRR